MTPTSAHEAILREEEFARMLPTASLEFCQFVSSLMSCEAHFDAIGAMARMVEAANSFETFLDDHGARQNRDFVTLGELVASIRGIAKVRVDNLHLVSRLPRYQLLQGSAELERGLEDAEAVLRLALLGLAGALKEELSTHSVAWPEPVAQFDEPVLRQRQLPRNLDVGQAVEEREHIAVIGSRFLSVVSASRHLDLDRRRELEELATYVSNHASEDRCRWYQSAVHNIQSMYDTYVLGTDIEEQNPWLHQLRGHTTVTYHLLVMATDLVHFYERHENDIRHEAAREAIAAVVPKTKILDVAVNTYLRYAYVFVEECSELAARVLTTFVSQQEVELELPAGLTLHARPLALIVQIARHHGSPIEISIEGEGCLANSLMSLIMLVGKYPDSKRMHAKGDGAAVTDLQLLFGAGLGETGELPSELSYLQGSG
jgi:phosphotransferase system HPr-like phosphotransfer protein